MDYESAIVFLGLVIGLGLLVVVTMYATKYINLYFNKQQITDAVPESVVDNLRKQITKNALEVNIVSVDTDIAVKAMQAMSKAIKELPAIQYERVLTNTSSYFTRPHFNKHDIWVGLYWKYATSELSDTFDELNIYVCLIPTIVFKWTRQRNYELKRKNK